MEECLQENTSFFCRAKSDACLYAYFPVRPSISFRAACTKNPDLVSPCFVACGLCVLTFGREW
jgi:hypothetical protein